MRAPHATGRRAAQRTLESVLGSKLFDFLVATRLLEGKLHTIKQAGREREALLVGHCWLAVASRRAASVTTVVGKAGQHNVGTA